jgi:hypothetical protein
MRKRPVKAVRTMIRAMKDLENNTFTGLSESPELQQVRSNWVGSRYYRRIYPKMPMTSAQFREAFSKKI